MLLLFVLCAVFAAVNGYNTTSVVQCIANQAELPLNAYVEGCTTPPCVLPQGQDVVIHVVFRSPRLLNEVQTLATAILQVIVPIPIEYPLNENANTCNFLTNTYCPLLPGEVVQYTLKMHIETFFPAGTQATIEFRAADIHRVPIWCIRLPISIVPPLA